MAGMLSTAKITSANSTKIRARNRGVTKRFFLFGLSGSGNLTKKLWPCSVLVTGRWFLSHFSSILSDKSGCFSLANSILIPVPTKKTAKISNTHSNRATKAAPTPIMMPRRITTPKIPHTKTRCWYFRGMAKKLKIMEMTKMLSSAKVFSIKNPVRYSLPAWGPNSNHTQPPKHRARMI